MAHASAGLPSGTTTSHWARPMPTFPPLGGDLQTDTVVVGASIVGLTTAYLLAREGGHVVLLERDEIGSGETARTSAQLTASLDFRYFELASIHGEERTRLIAQSHSAAIDEIERIAREEDIGCDFLRVPGFLFAPPDQREDLLHEHELGAMQNAGLKVRLVKPPAGTRHLGPCVRLEDQGAFHPVPVDVADEG
ncbi:FAD-binding oxidoreductase (plasmid) [Deinococcus metallilatus]|uniref:FAD-binding oxidoreductase n=1 Tax=Deinococcus metallilatus TaxID=1211322 RepID=A0AAJ5F851_9DEIO|nr:FAD-binding oxidoreductase [Deinococcus metallilatus]MBB5295665.1 glycine/D-amino acid oxidase-like deaminating enzyme [Deinococcus metallilatus]QBY06877.1 FAD-binding oxidoreductase [Deinococcus metallilatus]TLK32266.1 FAD-binding oxidoreductase [Deinococcus metallilatus]GMA14195.1 hypothetical protein GCM10025871_05260 [Deinococcus metallilatus]